MKWKKKSNWNNIKKDTEREEILEQNWKNELYRKSLMILDQSSFMVILIVKSY